MCTWTQCMKYGDPPAEGVLKPRCSKPGLKLYKRCVLVDIMMFRFQNTANSWSLSLLSSHQLCRFCQSAAKSFRRVSFLSARWIRPGRTASRPNSRRAHSTGSSRRRHDAVTWAPAGCLQPVWDDRPVSCGSELGTGRLFVLRRLQFGARRRVRQGTATVPSAPCVGSCVCGRVQADW